MLCGQAWAACLITTPQLNTNPNFDVVLTRTTPVLSFKNATGGQGKRVYEIQVARNKDFTIDLATFSLQENPEGVTALPIPTEKALADKTRWYWRVHAVDETGAQGSWATSRFSVDVASDKAFMGLTRAVPVSVKVSSGSDPKNLTDYSDQGLATPWRATPPGSDTERSSTRKSKSPTTKPRACCGISLRLPWPRRNNAVLHATASVANPKESHACSIA